MLRTILVISALAVSAPAFAQSMPEREDAPASVALLLVYEANCSQLTAKQTAYLDFASTEFGIGRFSEQVQDRVKRITASELADVPAFCGKVAQRFP